MVLQTFRVDMSALVWRDMPRKGVHPSTSMLLCLPERLCYMKTCVACHLLGSLLRALSGCLACGRPIMPIMCVVCPFHWASTSWGCTSVCRTGVAQWYKDEETASATERQLVDRMSRHIQLHHHEMRVPTSSTWEWADRRAKQAIVCLDLENGDKAAESQYVDGHGSQSSCTRRLQLPQKRSRSPQKRSQSPWKRSRSPRKPSLSPKRFSCPWRQQSQSPLRKPSPLPQMQQVPRYREVCVNLIPNFIEENVNDLTESHLHDIKHIVEEELLNRNIKNLTASLLQEAM